MNRIALRYLPEPDRLEFSWPEGCVCVVHGHGGDFAGELAGRLAARGWQTVLLTSAPIPVVEGTDVFHADPADPESLDLALAEIRRAYGRLSAYVEITARPESGAADMLSHASKTQLKSTFLAAKSLKPLLTDPDLPRAWHVTVDRFDGKLGLAGSGSSARRTGGGISGLAKTLGQEWPSVFCRNLDLHPDFNLEEAVDIVIAEIFDPDSSLAEVGRHPEGRFTIAAVEENHA